VVLSEGAQGGLDVLPDHVEVGRVHRDLALVPHQAVQPLHLVRHHVRALRLLKRVAAQNARPHLTPSIGMLFKGTVAWDGFLTIPSYSG
jgi:hypothetical protein